MKSFSDCNVSVDKQTKELIKPQVSEKCWGTVAADLYGPMPSSMQARGGGAKPSIKISCSEVSDLNKSRQRHKLKGNIRQPRCTDIGQ